MTMKIKPNTEKAVNGQPLEVFDPIRGDFIPRCGREVAELPYWIRMLAAGDVVRINEIVDETETKEKEAEQKQDDELSPDEVAADPTEAPVEPVEPSEDDAKEDNAEQAESPVEPVEVSTEASETPQKGAKKNKKASAEAENSTSGE